MPDYSNRTLASKSVPSKKEIPLLEPYISNYISKHGFPNKYILNPAAYLEEVDNYPHHWNSRYHPSSDMATPERILYYQKHPVIGPTFQKVDFSISSIIAMQIGTAIHAMFEAVLVDIGLTTKEDCEVFFKEETLGISGLCDIRKLKLPDGREVLVDLKTCSKVPTKLDPLHALQVALYVDLVEGAPKEDGIVLYIEKSYPHHIADFVVHQEDVKQDLIALYQKWHRVREALSVNDPSGLECCGGMVGKQECPVKDQCQKMKI